MTTTSTREMIRDVLGERGRDYDYLFDDDDDLSEVPGQTAATEEDSAEVVDNNYGDSKKTKSSSVLDDEFPLQRLQTRTTHAQRRTSNSTFSLGLGSLEGTGWGTQQQQEQQPEEEQDVTKTTGLFSSSLLRFAASKPSQDQQGTPPRLSNDGGRPTRYPDDEFSLAESEKEAVLRASKVFGTTTTSTRRSALWTNNNTAVRPSELDDDFSWAGSDKSEPHRGATPTSKRAPPQRTPPLPRSTIRTRSYDRPSRRKDDDNSFGGLSADNDDDKVLFQPLGGNDISGRSPITFSETNPFSSRRKTRARQEHEPYHADPPVQPSFRTEQTSFDSAATAAATAITTTRRLEQLQQDKQRLSQQLDDYQLEVVLPLEQSLVRVTGERDELQRQLAMLEARYKRRLELAEEERNHALQQYKELVESTSSLQKKQAAGEKLVPFERQHSSNGEEDNVSILKMELMMAKAEVATLRKMVLSDDDEDNPNRQTLGCMDEPTDAKHEELVEASMGLAENLMVLLRSGRDEEDELEDVVMEQLRNLAELRNKQPLVLDDLVEQPRLLKNAGHDQEGRNLGEPKRPSSTELRQILPPNHETIALPSHPSLFAKDGGGSLSTGNVMELQFWLQHFMRKCLAYEEEQEEVVRASLELVESNRRTNEVQVATLKNAMTLERMDMEERNKARPMPCQVQSCDVLVDTNQMDDDDDDFDDL